MDLIAPESTQSQLITDNIPEIVGQKIYSKTEQAFKLLSIGETAENALKLVNNKDNITRQAAGNLRKKFARWSLKNPSMVKLANNQVKRILKAEAREVEQQKVTKDGQVIDYIEKIVPSDTNILAASMMVYDRIEPIKSVEIGDNQGVQFIDLTTYNIQVNA